jgi:hypothetical protein
MALSDGHRLELLPDIGGGSCGSRCSTSPSGVPAGGDPWRWRRRPRPYVDFIAAGRRSPATAVAQQAGYRIPALPFLSRVEDPATFQPRFGSDVASCGFDLADALLVREDLADRVVAAGGRAYRERYAWCRRCS